MASMMMSRLEASISPPLEHILVTPEDEKKMYDRITIT
jgi:hypothetical protein